MKSNLIKHFGYATTALLMLLLFVSSRPSEVIAVPYSAPSEESGLFEEDRDEYEKPIGESSEDEELPPPPDPPENIDEPDPSESSDEESTPVSSDESNQGSSSAEEESSSQSSSSSSNQSSNPSSSSSTEPEDNGGDETNGNPNQNTGNSNSSNNSSVWPIFQRSQNQPTISYRRMAMQLYELATSQDVTLSIFAKALISADYIPIHITSPFMPLTYVYQIIVNWLNF